MSNVNRCEGERDAYRFRIETNGRWLFNEILPLIAGLDTERESEREREREAGEEKERRVQALESEIGSWHSESSGEYIHSHSDSHSRTRAIIRVELNETEKETHR